MTTTLNKKHVLSAVTLASALVLSACNDDDAQEVIDKVLESRVSLLIADDNGDETGTTRRFEGFVEPDTGLGNAQQTFKVGLAEGIAKDSSNTLYQAGIVGFGTIKAVCNLPVRTSGSSFDATRDRVISSALNSPKGIALAEKAGLIIAAETGAATNAVTVISASAASGSQPLYGISRAAVGNSGAWDIAYDETSDKLFVALTNGTVAYFANYLANAAMGSDRQPTAIFRPANPLTATNMHGIVYEASSDLLIVSDVGNASAADDGSLYVFAGASTLSGTVSASRTLRGAATLLGNPVDIALKDGDLFVAEKANGGGRILVFRNIASGNSGDIAPDRDYLSSKPESLIASPAASTTSMMSNSRSPTGLLVTSNASNTGTQTVTVDTGLTTQGKTFTPVAAGQFVESIAMDASGNALVSFDDAATSSTGGLSVVNRIQMRMDADTFSADKDRQFVGVATSLVAPKGIEVVDSKGVVLVADLNAAAPGAIKAFSLCAGGDTAPLMTTTLPAGARPWDVDYDVATDRLVVAATTGIILVYDKYMETLPSTPSRTIDPDDKSGFAATNLHGIVYDAATDRLIVSDVGSATDASDGRIYVTNNAAAADGLTALSLEIAGPMSMLGNPVDLAFDGRNLYVAEKSNNQLQRIDNLYSLSGLKDMTASLSLSFTAPESIALSY